MGHILELVNDAQALIERRRYNSALVLLLTAIDASAAKIYPKGCKSYLNPKDTMRPKERFIRFLSARLSDVFGHYLPDEIHSEPVIKDIGNEGRGPAKIIYEVFRTSVIHEGGLPEEERYVLNSNAEGNISLEIRGDEVRFSSGFLSLLICVVEGAPTNGLEFSVNHYRISPNEDISIESYSHRFELSYNLSIGRIGGIINTILDIGPTAYQVDDCQFAAMFNSVIHPGLKTGLCFSATEEPIFNFDDGITPYGVEVVRNIMKGLQINDIAS